MIPWNVTVVRRPTWWTNSARRLSMNPNTMTRHDLAAIIDHTLLKPEATRDDVAKLVAEGRELGVCAICISPNRLPLGGMAPERLHAAPVCGPPSGSHARRIKASAAELARDQGAAEADMVVNPCAVKDGRWEDVHADIAAVREALPRAAGGSLKVVMESAALTDQEIVSVCAAARDAEADFVKTSTGFHPAGGASVAAVQLMRETVGPHLGVKASGGIRTTEAAMAMVRAGASRLGLSGSAHVLEGL